MEALKAKGDDAFRGKRYDDAVRYYAKALELAPKDIKLLNNKSGCHCNLGEYDTALADAEKSIAAESNYRGYQRAGNAYMGKEMYKEAVASFDKAVDLNPGDIKLKGQLDEARRAVSGGGRSSTTSNSGSSSATNASSGSSGSYGDANAAAKRHLFVDFGVVLCAVLHVITMLFMPGISQTLWKGSLMAFGYRQVLILTAPNNGLGFKPFNKEHYKKLSKHFSFQWLVLTALMSLTGAPPQLLLLMAMCIYVITDIYAHKNYLGLPPFAQFQDKISPLLEKYLGTQQMRQQMVLQAAMCEVMTCIMALFAGAGISGMILMFQFIKFRWNNDQMMKMAMQGVSDGCGKLFYHPKCPGVIGNGFTTFKGLIHKFATM